MNHYFLTELEWLPTAPSQRELLKSPAVEATWVVVCREWGSLLARSSRIDSASACGQCFLQVSAATSGKIGLMAHWDASSKPAIFEMRGVHSIHQGEAQSVEGVSVGR